jgi:hypothetical protein
MVDNDAMIEENDTNITFADYHLSMTSEFYEEFCSSTNCGEKWK